MADQGPAPEGGLLHLLPRRQGQEREAEELLGGDQREPGAGAAAVRRGLDHAPLLRPGPRASWPAGAAAAVRPRVF